MSNYYRLQEYRKSTRRIFFERQELNQLLSLYSQRVAAGEWRDYAIDQAGGAAIFSVFRHSHDAPLFSIAKKVGGPGRGREFVVFRGREELKHASTLPEALKVFRQKLRVVS